MVDRNRALKLEDALGGTTVDREPTETAPNSDGLDARAYFVQSDSSNDSTTFLSRTSAGMTFADANTSHTLKELVSSSPGQVGSHNALLDVVHFLADGPGDGWPSGMICQDSYNGLLLASSTWFADAARQKRIVAKSWTYSGLLVATEKTTLYAADGATILRTVLDTYTYNGTVRASRVRTWGTT